MNFASKNLVRTWLFITIVALTAVNVFGSGEKRLDLKIGFDLIQEANGAPSLRIRDFEDSSEIKARAKDDSTEPRSKSPVRADSFSDSEQEPPVKVHHKVKRQRSAESKENPKSNDNNDDDTSLDEDLRLSTRGLGVGEYEPEERPNIHHRYQSSGENSGN